MPQEPILAAPEDIHGSLVSAFGKTFLKNIAKSQDNPLSNPIRKFLRAYEDFVKLGEFVPLGEATTAIAIANLLAIYRNLDFLDEELKPEEDPKAPDDLLALAADRLKKKGTPAVSVGRFEA